MHVKSWPSKKERKIVKVRNCIISKTNDQIQVTVNGKAYPVEAVFRKYVGDWINFKIMEENIGMSSELTGIQTKFKVIEVDGRLVGETKWKKRKHHEYQTLTFELQEIFEEFVGETVWIRTNPNVKEIGVK